MSDQQRLNEIACVESLREQLIAREDAWRNTCMGNARWWLLLVGKLDLTLFVSKFRSALTNWLTEERITVGAMIYINRFHRVWSAVPDKVKAEHPELVALLATYVKTPDALCFPEVRQNELGPCDCSEGFDKFWEAYAVGGE